MQLAGALLWIEGMSDLKPLSNVKTVVNGPSMASALYDYNIMNSK